MSATLSLATTQYNLHSPRTMEGHQLLDHTIPTVTPNAVSRAPRQVADVVETLDFTSFAMNYYDGASFVYDGGKLTKYKTTITWYEDGTVSIDNLFNMRQHNDDQDEDLIVWGTYDADEHLISIATPEDNMPLVSMIWGQLNGYLLAGEATADIDFYPADALQLRVSEDKKKIETLQNALILEEYDGTLSTHTCVKYIEMYRACEGQKLVAFCPSKIDFDQPLYPGTSQKRVIYLTNVGSDAMEYSVTLDADANSSFSLTAASGTIRSMILREVKLTYAPQQIGEDKANLHINAAGEELTLPVSGFCVDYPDYSPLISEGDIEFRTGVDYPFELVVGEEGIWAQSSLEYQVGSSWLEAVVEVPAGKIGSLIWTGTNFCDYFLGSKGTVTVDDGRVLFESYMGYEKIDGNCRFTEGTHSVRFEYVVSHPEFVSDSDKMQLTDFRFVLKDLEDDLVVLPYGPNLPFGNFVVNQQSATLNARLLNVGANPLACLSADDSEHFHVGEPENKAVTLDTLLVPVTFDIPAVGSYAEEITLHTTAGDLVLACSALVREVPDYTRIEAADNDQQVPITWRYSTSLPFVIDEETLEAVNSNARVLDTIADFSWMEASFTIPKGKVGVVSWDASLDIEDVNPDGMYHDYAMVYIVHPNHQYYVIDIGQNDMSSVGCYSAFEEEEETVQYFTSGENSILWGVSHFGDSSFGGTDEYRISNFSIQLEDFPEYKFEANVEEIDFGQTLLNKSNRFTLQLTNRGGQILSVEKVECELPVKTIYYPTWSAPYGVSFELIFEFEGVWPGEYEGTIVVYTSSGELELPFRGVVVDPTGYLMAEDFEGEMTWYRSDADGDGKCWNTLYNIYSTMSDGHCHSGIDGLGSSGYYYYLGDIDPDDWCYSPMFEIPAEGEYELSWWMGVDDSDDNLYAHNYAVYVGEEMNRETLTQLCTQQITGTGWHYGAVSLKEWAGKTVCVSFRHYDSYGLGIMKLDDVYVRPVNSEAISKVSTRPSDIRIYNLQGQQQSHLGTGLNLIRTPEGVRKVLQ